jgi:hypothetical protein
VINAEERRANARELVKTGLVSLVLTRDLVGGSLYAQRDVWDRRIDKDHIYRMHNFGAKSQTRPSKRVQSILLSIVENHSAPPFPDLPTPTLPHIALTTSYCRYIHTVESRLHEVEALLGILLSISDNRAVTVLADIAEDPFARQIIERVNHSPFGPLGRKNSPVPSQSASTSEAGGGNGNGNER